MTTQNVADRMILLMREGKYEEAQKEFYAEDIVSMEPEGTPKGTVHGLDAILERGKQWDEMVEKVHSNEVSDPIVADNFFSCSLKSRITFKGNPEPVDMEEICVYEVSNGKIVKEQFFYTPMPEVV